MSYPKLQLSSETIGDEPQVGYRNTNRNHESAATMAARINFSLSHLDYKGQRASIWRRVLGGFIAAYSSNVPDYRRRSGMKEFTSMMATGSVMG